MTQPTLFDRLQDQLDRGKANDVQRRAVAAWLLEKGTLRRDFAYNTGLPQCGRIKNVGGRIHELRAMGWMIETEKDAHTGECIYRFVSKP